MCEEKCYPEPLSPGIPVVPLPVALYVSNGLIFELYEGGHTWRKHVIQWERLRTIDDAEETK